MTLLTRKDVAARLGVGYVKAGRLMQHMAVVQIGERVRVTEEALEAWIAGNTIQPIRLADSVTAARRHKPAELTASGRIPKRGET